MAFITNLQSWDIHPIAGTDNWINQKSLAYHSILLKKTVRIPIGYHTDLASIPRLLHWFMNPASKHIRAAAVVHDYCYTDLCQDMTKQQADLIIREAMGCVVWPAPIWKRNVVYLAVRIGGKGNW